MDEENIKKAVGEVLGKDLEPFEAIKMERMKQDVKGGMQNHSDLKWLAILSEEVGDDSKCDK